MKATIAEIANLKKSFGSNAVLKGINLKIERGENLVVFGKSGSGKSVLIKCLIGLLKADEGRIVLFGKDISGLKDKELNAVRKKVGFLFQSAALYDSMTVRENLEFPLRDLKSGSKEEMEALVREALKNVGLEKAIDKMPSELSGGMRKRVGLARTLILKPDLILYDEPTTGLDPVTSKEISKLILDVQEKYNTASLIITHDVECARITANRMMIIKEGLTIAEGSFKELSGSEDEWVRSFFS
ncbi:MAG TPA: ATP-binding cassette domain-containing protein [Cytophagaceae bacterium]|jgi:phospholipid/cholesterol/gamma-HCH transport system ATP-binding protein|nr:ATP-binding cassette domain-containing protein [Cytophagaceae bacterium]